MRFLITCAGSSGKTTLLNAILNQGFCCFYEVSREIIKEQQLLGGDLMPWKNMEAFGAECLIRMKKQLSTPCFAPTFYGRGIPDIMAYYSLHNITPNCSYYKPLPKYNKIAFICPPWEKYL